MIPVQTTMLRPRSGIILLALIPLIIVLGVANTLHKDNTIIIVSALMMLIPVGIYIFITNSYVEVDNDGITSKNPFKTKSILWKDVTNSYFKVIHTGKSSKRMWYFENFDQRFRFATNLYSRKALRTIAEALMSKCPNAEIDQKIRNIAEGKFPWYIF
jgi:c-di-AMP phosphodiesterase-like protein